MKATRLFACMLLAPLLLGTAPFALAQKATGGKVTGRILGLKAGESVKGAKVVLVRFTLDEKGQPQGSPIQMQDADSDGAYVFENVPIDTRSVYQLGTRIDGALIPSESFTFPEGERIITLNLRVPEVVADSTSLRILQALVALEPQVGGVWVTDVVHLENPTKNVIEGTRTPLEFVIPSKAERFEVIGHEGKSGNVERVGNKVLMSGNVQPGVTTVALRYHVPVWLGSLSLSKTYPRPVKEMVVLAPTGALRVTSQRLDARQPQKIEGQTYDVWGGTDLAPDTAVALKASGVPVEQGWLLAPFALILVVLAGVVAWYVRSRLGPVAPAPR